MQVHVLFYISQYRNSIERIAIYNSDSLQIVSLTFGTIEITFRTTIAFV